MLRSSSRTSALAALLVLVACLQAQAARPGDILLPNTTKGFVSVPDVNELSTKFDETQMGQLLKDPVMQPFVEDLRRQFSNKLNNTGVKLGLTFEDLQDLYGGELCIAVIQPDNDKAQHALAVLVNVTGHLEQANALLAKVTKSMADRKATRVVRKVGDVNMVVFTLPKQKDQLEALKVVYVVTQDQLLATDHEKVAEGIVARFTGEHTDTLSTLPAYQTTLRRCQKEIGEGQPHAIWFAEPFGYLEVARAAGGGRKRRGTDMLKVLSNQGFHAIQGVGGHVAFSDGKHEVLHRTFVFAPAVQRAADDKSTDKYDLAARIMDFPRSAGLTAQPWIPRHSASYVTFNLKIRESFEYSKTLVDELAGDEVFEDVIKSIEIDPHGPRINVRSELIAHLGKRATVLTDYRLPITTKSERAMVAIELLDAQAVAKTVDKAMESDPNAKKRVFNGQVIWEILNEQEPELAVKIEAPGFGAFGPEEDEKPAEGEKPLIQNAAVTVAHGHLIVSTHVDFIVDLLGQAAAPQSLGHSADYQIVQEALEKLGAGEDSLRMFTRTDEAYRPTYELIKQGKMPEAETLLGKALNRLFGPEEEGVLREQQIDGTKMPDFEAVRRYLGPGGLFVQQEADGWLVVGCLLNKEAE